MITKLEFAIQRLHGKATSTSGNGESYWDCPNCGSSRFHTMPDKPGFKHRFKCWACDFRGDIFDLLAHFFPEEDFGQRKIRLAIRKGVREVSS